MTSRNEFIAVENLLDELPQGDADYVSAVWKALSDRSLTAQDRDFVKQVAKTWGISRDDRRRLHFLFLRNVAIVTLATDSAPELESERLRRLGKLLGLESAEADLAISEALNSTEKLSSALIEATSSETAGLTAVARLKAIRPKSMISAAATGISAVTAGASAATAVAVALASSRMSQCEKCGTETSHRVQLGKDFPVKAWSSLLWKSLTPSLQGFVLNAATLAASDRQLMAKTGKAIVPKFYCERCKKECNSYQSASLFLMAFKLSKKAKENASTIEVKLPDPSNETSPTVG